MLANPASPFVADFVGADRGIKRLGVVLVERSHAEPGSSDGLPVVTVGSSLRDALAAMLASRTWATAVRDGDDVVGILSADKLFAAAVA